VCWFCFVVVVVLIVVWWEKGGIQKVGRYQNWKERRPFFHKEISCAVAFITEGKLFSTAICGHVNSKLELHLDACQQFFTQILMKRISAMTAQELPSPTSKELCLDGNVI
jgi:hypothetical protein